MTFPPEPWALSGQMHVAAFLVPLADVPVDLPPRCVPVTFRGRGIVGTAWVSYEQPGVLTYREVMATLLVRRGRRVLPTIVRIWVDSVASRDGGRALWGIPKELAEFTTDPWSAAGIAGGTVARRFALPGRWPVGFRIVQTLDGAAKISPVRACAHLTVDRATFTAEPGGPIGFLAGRRPFAALSLRDFRMSFGARSARGGAARANGVEWAR